jgi:enoyl-CoA hydratase/carnithine racemase
MSDKPESVGREVLFEVADHIATVTLNRPEKRNAVNAAIALGLQWAVTAVESDDEIRAAILYSSLDTVFCAGADLGEIARGNGRALSTEQGGFAGFVDARKDKPWIAAVRGSAVAGGCELSLACDMIVASDNAEFGLPEVKRGIMAGAGGAHRLPRAIPRNVAFELIATGAPMSAARAMSLGLVNRVVPLCDVLAEAQRLARQIAANAPLAVRASLGVARRSAEMSDADLRRLSHEVSAQLMRSEDAKEGPLAFIQKRAPVWRGK